MDQFNEFAGKFERFQQTGICLYYEDQYDGLNCNPDANAGNEEGYSNFRMKVCKKTYDYLFSVSRKPNWLIDQGTILFP